MMYRLAPITPVWYNLTMALSSTIATVRELVSLMKEHDVTRCILCPGSRNAPISLTLAQAEGFECRNVTDERSAGFAALGWATQSKAPVAVCVTSGSALLNLHPAVAEAFYRHIPLLVISADRPAAWINQQDGQTLPQPNAISPLCRKSVNLPEYDEYGWHTNRLLNEALLELRHRAGGPVHINVPLDEPLFETTGEPIAPTRVIRRTELAHMDADEEQELIDIAAALPRRMLLLGQMGECPNIPDELKEEHAFAVVAEHLSNCHNADCYQPDTLIGPNLEEPNIESPELLITMGGCLVSKRLKQYFRHHPPVEHWHICKDGEVCDTFCSLTRVIEGDPDELLELLVAFSQEGDDAYRSAWCYQPTKFQAEYSGMTLVGELLSTMPEDSVLHLANSSAVRYAQLFPLKAGVAVECNRGVNGIEGSLSTAFGYALGDERLQFIVCGDLSFFYDMNALWQDKAPENTRILLLNNGTGGIFHAIGAPDIDAVRGAHHTSAEAWAKSCGWNYKAIRADSDYRTAIVDFCAVGAGPTIIEAFTDSVSDAAILKNFYNKH